MNYIISEVQNNVGILTLNRAEALNAVCLEMLEELAAQIKSFDMNNHIGAIVLKGNDKAFAAGIDLNEVNQKTFEKNDFIEDYRQAMAEIFRCRKPIIAAVAGYALGIGCELALNCDIILAADNARFGQPEISLGTVTGFGGSQLLSKAVGKAKAMEMVLTGRAMNAEEAERSGLVSRIVPLPDLFAESLKTAEKIALMPRTAVILAKDAIKHAQNVGLEDGIEYEHKNCQICLNSEDFKESLEAFVEKRTPNFRNQ